MDKPPGIIAHIDETGRSQTVEEHLQGTAKLAAAFAGEFGMASWGYALGMLHDKGKERRSFQQYIRGAANPGEHNHSWVGALLARQLYGPTADCFLTNPIASHHRGLCDADNLAKDLEHPLPKEVAVPSQYALEPPQFPARPQKDDAHHIARLLFSCLVDADRLDTEAWVCGHPRSCHATLAELLPMLDDHLRKLQASAPTTDVNKVRAEVQASCLSAAEGGQGFYRLTVPTGGGKTLSSLAWAMHHAVRHGLRRIIIAIPYTSIIVQTAATLKAIFGEANVLEHHSDFDFGEMEDSTLCQRAMQAVENWDCPIVVTTNVQLFESMFANKPAPCRKLHNIARSVVVLDEVQALPTDFLGPIAAALDTYRRLFGISAIFTTATQPEWDKSFPEALRTAADIIAPDARLADRLRRVEIHIDGGPSTYDEIAKRLAAERQVLCVVNTRADAREIFTRLPQDEGLAIHLSRQMCPCHIREQIAKIRKALAGGEGIVRVVATQLIEAGVDIDFPVVYRQEAGLDSVLQAAGRCNREGKRGISPTHVFSLAKEHPLPKGHISAANNARLNLPAEADPFSPGTIAEYYRQLWCRTQTFDKNNICSRLAGREPYFRSAAEDFRLIDDKGISIVVPHEGAADLVARLKEEGMSYGLARKLSAYTVNVYPSDFRRLAEAGAVEQTVQGVYVVADPGCYDERTGLKLDNHWQEEILII